MRFFLLFALLLSGSLLFSCTSDDPEPAVDAVAHQSLATEMTNSLRRHVLDPWYPHSIDEDHGGFLTRYTHDWEPEGPQDKMIVTQARLVWTASRATEFFPEDETLLSSAEHGYHFLKDVMWDQEYGGFYTQVTREGEVMRQADGRIVKEAYGTAFSIYALAAYAEATGDEPALELAIKAFHWLEQHSYDPQYGGYFNYMQRDGTPYKTGYDGTPPKDQNSSIHLLEAFSELYTVWPDPLLKERLTEMLALIRDTIREDPGHLTLFSNADWTPVSYRDSSDAVREENYYFDHVSFGHDVETAYLMLEASEVLGIEDDSLTHLYAKQMVDHSLANGWDKEVGGFYTGGYYFPGESGITIVRDNKNWWSQAEGMNTLLLMASLYPDSPQEYQAKFNTLWLYTKEYLIDDNYGGWYEWGIDKTPESQYEAKGHIWKTNYHDGRTMMNIIKRVEEE
ncbi:MAG: AGE family epimerase/isomerase [Balneolales bacterium]